jgi:regulator of telomere elongation helicase 1
MRESLGINIENSIVVVDEAHNIEDTCREAG